MEVDVNHVVRTSKIADNVQQGKTKLLNVKNAYLLLFWLKVNVFLVHPCLLVATIVKKIQQLSCV